VSRTFLGGFVLALASVLPGLHAVEKQYQTARIVKVEQKAHTRVLYYLVNTPVTQDDPYFELSVQFRDVIYVGQYTPRHAADALPEEWKAGAEVQARLEKHNIYLKGPGGADWRLVVVRHMAAPAETGSPGPVPAKK
jgi:hypothetical protein